MYDIIVATKGDDHGSFESIKAEYPHALWLPRTKNIGTAMRQARDLALTEMFWLVTDEFFRARKREVDLAWKPPEFDRVYPHRWDATQVNGRPMRGYRGLYLIPRSYEITDDMVRAQSLGKVKSVHNFDIVTDEYDIFFISYDERYADRHFGLLQRRFPRVRRVHGIEGIANAHRFCAEQSRGEMFWTVDADTLVDETFDFDFEPEDYDRAYLHVWKSRNPVNDLEYGWGAIKLWPRDLVLAHDGGYLDFTTSAGNLKIMDEVVATSSFNSDPFRAWRSGFREAVKLARNVHLGDTGESLGRLHRWCSVAKRVPNASDAMRGANDGLWYFMEGDEAITRINDFAWLHQLYMSRESHIGRDWENGSMSMAAMLEYVGVEIDV